MKPEFENEGFSPKSGAPERAEANPPSHIRDPNSVLEFPIQSLGFRFFPILSVARFRSKVPEFQIQSIRF